MLDRSTKFKYFYSILKEVYVIIDINENMTKEDVPRLIDIIRSHLLSYNIKSNFLQMGLHYDNEKEMLEINLSDYVPMRGMKKLFEANISIKSIFRDKLIDEVFKELDKLDIEDFT